MTMIDTIRATDSVLKCFGNLLINAINASKQLGKPQINALWIENLIDPIIYCLLWAYISL